MFGWQFFFLAVPLAAFCICFAMQMVFTHLVVRVGYVWAWLLGFVCGAVAMIAAEAVALLHVPQGFGREGLCLAFANLLIYPGYCYCYFAVIQSGVSSVRTRMLLELQEATGGLTLTGLLERYGARDMLSLRLDRLVSGGQLVLRDGRYYSGKKHIALFIVVEDLMRFIILGRRPSVRSDPP